LDSTAINCTSAVLQFRFGRADRDLRVPRGVRAGLAVRHIEHRHNLNRSLGADKTIAARDKGVAAAATPPPRGPRSIRLTSGRARLCK